MQSGDIVHVLKFLLSQIAKEIFFFKVKKKNQFWKKEDRYY